MRGWSEGSEGGGVRRLGVGCQWADHRSGTLERGVTVDIGRLRTAKTAPADLLFSLGKCMGRVWVSVLHGREICPQVRMLMCKLRGVNLLKLRVSTSTCVNKFRLLVNQLCRLEMIIASGHFR